MALRSGSTIYTIRTIAREDDAPRDDIVRTSRNIDAIHTYASTWRIGHFHHNVLQSEIGLTHDAEPNERLIHQIVIGSIPLKNGGITVGLEPCGGNESTFDGDIRWNVQGLAQWIKSMAEAKMIVGRIHECEGVCKRCWVVTRACRSGGCPVRGHIDDAALLRHACEKREAEHKEQRDTEHFS